MANKPLTSERAREIVRMRATQDADGSHIYTGASLIKTMLHRIEDELIREYEVALQRHVRLREVIGA